MCSFVLFIGAIFCIICLCFYVFCLLVVLVKLSVLAKWLARKTSLRTPLRGKEIISTKSRPKSGYDFWFMVLFHCFYCVIVLTPALDNIVHIPMAQYGLFVQKMPLKTQSTNRPTTTTIGGGWHSGSTLVFNQPANLLDRSGTRRKTPTHRTLLRILHRTLLRILLYNFPEA